MSKLNSAHILVTRPAHQANALCDLITAHGGVAVRFPALEIVAQDDALVIQEKLAQVDKFQWLVFVSANAVNFAVKTNGGKIRQLTSTRIAAIGAATAQALQSAGLSVDLMPTTSYNSEALLAMPDMLSISGQALLIVRGDKGREELANTLRDRGATVDYLDVYKRVIPDIDNQQVLALLATRQLNAVTATSVEVLRNLFIMLGNGARQQLLTTPLVVVSERIKSVAVDMGFERVAVTEYPSDTAILETVTTYVTGG